MKKFYVEPKIEVVNYEVEDCLQTSAEFEPTTSNGEWLPGYFD
jgi:hypothetical protein